jgi:hypothetical protein
MGKTLVEQNEQAFQAQNASQLHFIPFRSCKMIENLCQMLLRPLMILYSKKRNHFEWSKF